MDLQGEKFASVTGNADSRLNIDSTFAARGDGIRFIPFEPAIRLDFTVLMPPQRRPPMLAHTYVDFVRSHVLAQLDPEDLLTD